MAKACFKVEIVHPIEFCKNCYEVNLLPFNTKYDDFSPLFYKNLLVYTTTNRAFQRKTIPRGQAAEGVSKLVFTIIDTLDEINQEFIYEDKYLYINKRHF